MLPPQPLTSPVIDEGEEDDELVGDIVGASKWGAKNGGDGEGGDGGGGEDGGDY
jgi:hypothetical protein